MSWLRPKEANKLVPAHLFQNPHKHLHLSLTNTASLKQTLQTEDPELADMKGAIRVTCSIQTAIYKVKHSCSKYKTKNLGQVTMLCSARVFVKEKPKGLWWLWRWVSKLPQGKDLASDSRSFLSFFLTLTLTHIFHWIFWLNSNIIWTSSIFQLQASFGSFWVGSLYRPVNDIIKEMLVLSKPEGKRVLAFIGFLCMC